MKKVLFLLVAFASLCTAQAQFSFGVKSGINLASLSGSDATGAKMKIGFMSGGFANVKVGSMFSVQGEVNYSGQGAKFDGGQDNLNYVNVPVLFQYNHPSGFYAETGPQIGFLVTAKAKEDGGGTTDIKDQAKSTDVSWAIGIGFLTNFNLGFDARFNAGLTSVAAGDGKLQNSVIQIGTFYSFGKKSSPKAANTK
jgi:hypothetical protein